MVNSEIEAISIENDLLKRSTKYNSDCVYLGNWFAENKSVTNRLKMNPINFPAINNKFKMVVMWSRNTSDITVLELIYLNTLRSKLLNKQLE